MEAVELGDEIYRSIRMSPLEVRSLLADLDTRARSAIIGSHPKREHARLEYRVYDILVAIRYPGQTPARYLVTSRNLSAGGMSFLHGGFLHAGTACFVLLTDIEGEHVRVVGTVRSCRHVSKSLHEVGVEFRQKLDPRRFCGDGGRLTSNDPDLLEMALPTLSGQAMLISEDAALRRSVTARLTATGMTATGVESIGAAADKIKQVGFDVLLFDSATRGADAGSAGPLREAGYEGPIVCVSESVEGGLAMSPEVAAVLYRPVRADLLIAAVAGLLAEFGGTMSDRPMRSLLGGRRAMAESIDRFVEAAREAGPDLVEAFECRRLDRVGEICAMLRRDGGQTGFAVIGEAARRALAHLGEETEEEGGEDEREASVRFLAGLCERVRPGVDAGASGASESRSPAADEAA